MSVCGEHRGKIEEDSEALKEKEVTKGKFIVATNDLDRTRLSSQDLLDHYQESICKEQQCVERGIDFPFGFLKDPLFMTSSVFLKNEERVVALSMIMCLCLLVYMIAQRLRSSPAVAKAEIRIGPNRETDSTSYDSLDFPGV